MKVFTYIKDNSSRVPKKNFRNLCGLELWKHLVYELKDFDVYIDTDSEYVVKECVKDPLLSHVIAFEREQRFIDMENNKDNKLSPALLMVENFLNKYAEDDEEIIVTHVTSPFLTSKTINDAVKKLNDYEFVHSVYSVQDFAWIGDNFNPLNFDPNVVQRTQDVDKVHFSNGGFFMFKKSTFNKYKARLGPNTFYYELPREESIEIDTEEDLRFAEILGRGLNG